MAAPAGATLYKDLTVSTVDNPEPHTIRVYSDGIGLDPAVLVAQGFVQIPDTQYMPGGPVLPQQVATGVPAHLVASSQPGDDGGSGADDHPTTTEDVVRWFIQYLNRRPAYEEVAGRLGEPANLVEADIASSPEAVAVRAGGGVPVGPVGPQGPQGPGGGAGGGGGGGGGGSWGPGGPPAITGLDTALQSVLGAVLQQLTGLHGDIGTIADSIAGDVQKAVQAAAPSIERAVSAISKQVGGIVEQVLPGIGSVLLSAFGGIEALVTSFLASAADVTDLAKAFSGEVEAKRDGLSAAVFGILVAWLKEVGQSFLTNATDGVPTATVDLLGRAASDANVPAFQRDAIAQLGAGTGIGIEIVRLLANAIGLLKGALEVGDPMADYIKQLAYEFNPTSILDPRAAIEARHRGFLDAAAAGETVLRGGFDGAQLAALNELVKVRPDASTLVQAYRLRLLDSFDALAARLRELGYDAEAAALIEQVARQLPDAGTLTRLADRGLFDPGASSFSGLDAMHPAFVEGMGHLGYDEETAALVWAGHYRPVDPGTAAAALFRGYITVDNFRETLRANGIPPAWREAILRTQFAVYSRRDWLRLVKLGLFDKVALTAAIRESGYTAERADVLASMFMQLAEADVSAEKKRLADAHRRTVIDLVHGQIIDAATAIAQLVDLGYSEEEANADVSNAALAVEVKRIGQVLAALKPFYVKGLWTADETSAALLTYEVPPHAAASALAEWGIARDLRELTAEELAGRDAQAGELRQAFLEGVINEASYRAHLAALRWTADAIEITVALAQIARHKAGLADAEALIREQLLAGAIDELGASNALDALGVGPAARDRLVTKWLKEVDAAQAKAAKAAAAASNGSTPIEAL